MIRRPWKVCAVVVFCVFVSACDTGMNYAPVVDVSSIESIPKSGTHTVTHGESLYEIAFRYGQDYRYVAEQNQMKSPYVLYTGQVIYLRGAKPAVIVKADNKTIEAEQTVQVVKTTEPNYTTSKWIWPAKGKVVNAYSRSNKGINIAGWLGETVYASAPGKVVYSGNGLRAYGNLIIVKHNSLYLSAYAYNRAVFVKEGDWVKQGQRIAEIGSAGTGQSMLHFEIRRAGKPVNPVSLLNTE